MPDPKTDTGKPVFPLDVPLDMAATSRPQPPLRRFTFRNFSGVHEVEAADVEFAPTHVVFRGASGEIVLAEPADKIQRLREEPRRA
jgi:hypothetical protein